MLLFVIAVNYLRAADLSDEVGLFLTESVQLLAISEHQFLHHGQAFLCRSCISQDFVVGGMAGDDSYMGWQTPCDMICFR